MNEKRRSKFGKIIETIGFTILVIISLVVMAVVIWIHFKNWTN
jgi:hypothetical protein